MKSEINFDEEYVASIIERRKQTTIRRGIKIYPVGEIVYLKANKKTFAKARISKIVVKRMKELTNEDAERDGFKSREELINALKRIYGIKEDEFVTVVYFEVIN
jgi:hypothetical protein